MDADEDAYTQPCSIYRTSSDEVNGLNRMREAENMPVEIL